MTTMVRKRVGPVPDPSNILVKGKENVPNRLLKMKTGRLRRKLGKNKHRLRRKIVKVIFPVTLQILQAKLFKRALKTAQFSCALTFCDGDCTIYDLRVLHYVTQSKLRLR